MGTPTRVEDRTIEVRSGNPFTLDELARHQVAYTIGTEAADVINVALQVSRAGANVAERHVLTAYISDDVDGDGVAATAPSGGVAIGTDGAILAELVTDKVLLLQTDATGKVDIDITQTGADTFYLVVVRPDGSLDVSGAITFAV